MASDQEPCRTLAVLSNYECMRRGTLSQLGLKYSDDFTAQVFSKKERHRTEERTRRNQLAYALRELETTVAQTQASTAFQTKTRSKVETVNAATALIKELRGKVRELEAQCRQEDVCMEMSMQRTN